MWRPIENMLSVMLKHGMILVRYRPYPPGLHPVCSLSNTQKNG